MPKSTALSVIYSTRHSTVFIPSTRKNPNLNQPPPGVKHAQDNSSLSNQNKGLFDLTTNPVGIEFDHGPDIILTWLKGGGFFDFPVGALRDRYLFASHLLPWSGNAIYPTPLSGQIHFSCLNAISVDWWWLKDDSSKGRGTPVWQKDSNFLTGAPALCVGRNFSLGSFGTFYANAVIWCESLPALFSKRLSFCELFCREKRKRKNFTQDSLLIGVSWTLFTHLIFQVFWVHYFEHFSLVC